MVLKFSLDHVFPVLREFLALREMFSSVLFHREPEHFISNKNNVPLFTCVPVSFLSHLEGI